MGRMRSQKTGYILENLDFMYVPFVVFYRGFHGCRTNLLWLAGLACRLVVFEIFLSEFAGFWVVPLPRRDVPRKNSQHGVLGSTQ